MVLFHQVWPLRVLPQEHMPHSAISLPWVQPHILKLAMYYLTSVKTDFLVELEFNMTSELQLEIFPLLLQGHNVNSGHTSPTIQTNSYTLFS